MPPLSWDNSPARHHTNHLSGTTYTTSPDPGFNMPDGAFCDAELTRQCVNGQCLVAPTKV